MPTLSQAHSNWWIRASVATHLEDIKFMHDLPILLAIGAVAILLNVPLGYLRQRVRRFSWQWFVYIHLAIPIIILLRVSAGFGWATVPYMATAALSGQILGSMLAQRLVRLRTAPKEPSRGVSTAVGSAAARE
jgi:hypothetical protein